MVDNDIEIYKEQGMAIFVKGKLVYGTHPDNLLNNLEALSTGKQKIDWPTIYSDTKTVNAEVLQHLLNVEKELDRHLKHVSSRYRIDEELEKIKEHLK